LRTTRGPSGANSSSFAFDDMGDLRIGEKEIIGKLNEHKKMKRFFDSLLQRID
jgi:hypothetical protein